MKIEIKLHPGESLTISRGLAPMQSSKLTVSLRGPDGLLTGADSSEVLGHQTPEQVAQRLCDTVRGQADG